MIVMVIVDESHSCLVVVHASQEAQRWNECMRNWKRTTIIISPSYQTWDEVLSYSGMHWSYEPLDRCIDAVNGIPQEYGPTWSQPISCPSCSIAQLYSHLQLRLRDDSPPSRSKASVTKDISSHQQKGSTRDCSPIFAILACSPLEAAGSLLSLASVRFGSLQFLVKSS